VVSATGVAATPASASDEPAEPPKKGVTLVPVLWVNYDSDNGVGFGGALALDLNDGRTQPYKLGAVAQLMQTTEGVSEDYINLDWVHPLDWPLRLGFEARYHYEPNASWFGAGNLSPKPPDATPAYNKYNQRVFAARATVQVQLHEHAFAYATFLSEYAIERNYPDSRVLPASVRESSQR